MKIWLYRRERDDEHVSSSSLLTCAEDSAGSTRGYWMHVPQLPCSSRWCHKAAENIELLQLSSTDAL